MAQKAAPKSFHQLRLATTCLCFFVGFKIGQNQLYDNLQKWEVHTKKQNEALLAAKQEKIAEEKRRNPPPPLAIPEIVPADLHGLVNALNGRE
jgi:hypothetical protein